MLKICEIQTLYVEKETDFGIYLVSEEDKDVSVARQDAHVLLPKKQVPAGIKKHDSIEVFLYRDSSDRLIATTTKPYITLHDVAKLRVAQVAGVGAFLDWGLEKDLLLPFAEQTRKVNAGDEVLVACYIDKSGRICATMNVYPYLSSDSPYKKDDHVTGTVYETSDNFGTFVAVDDCFQGLIPKKELFGQVNIGETITARVISVREDGKLNLSIREKAYVQIGADADRLLKLLDEYNGVFPFSEKASPEVINRETGMSKNEFKKAIGNLYKNHKIEITEDGKIRKL